MFALLLLNLELSRGGWMQKRLPQNKHCAIIQHFRNAQLQSRRFQMSPTVSVSYFPLTDQTANTGNCATRRAVSSC